MLQPMDEGLEYVFVVGRGVVLLLVDVQQGFVILEVEAVEFEGAVIVEGGDNGLVFQIGTTFGYHPFAE